MIWKDINYLEIDTQERIKVVNPLKSERLMDEYIVPSTFFV